MLISRSFFAMLTLSLWSSLCCARPLSLDLFPRLDGDKLIIEGWSDAPDHALIEWEVRHENFANPIGDAVEHFTADGKIPVVRGFFQTEINLQHWDRGLIRVRAVFRPAALGAPQPNSVTKLYGPRGEYLDGPNVTTFGQLGELRRVVVEKTLTLASKSSTNQGSADNTGFFALPIAPPNTVSKGARSFLRAPVVQTNLSNMPPASSSIPASTVLSVRLVDPIDLTRGNVGHLSRATIDRDVQVGGLVAIQKGADALVKVIMESSPGIVNNPFLTVDLMSVRVSGHFVEVVTTECAETPFEGEEQATRHQSHRVLRLLMDLGVAGSIGAATGAVVGGPPGAAIGATAGVAVAAERGLLRRPGRTKLPSETQLVFTLSEPVDL
jgi:hypothetical protein